MTDTNIRKRTVPKKVPEEINLNKEISEKSLRDLELKPNNRVSLRVFARIVIIISLMVIVYVTSNKENFLIFAKQSQVLAGKGQIVECSLEHMRDKIKYERCISSECKRYVTDQIVTTREADGLLSLAKKVLEFGRSAGGVSIIDLHSGALSIGEHFINIYKLPEAKELFTENEFNLYRVVKEKIKYSLAHHFNVDPSTVYSTHPTFFSEITPKKAVTIRDEYYHPHVDQEAYDSFHYTTLLYLNDYYIDFKGGRFVYIDDKINQTVEPRKGRVNMFTSGSENFHYVEKVSSGVRYAITIPFTCDPQNAIEDPNINKLN